MPCHEAHNGSLYSISGILSGPMRRLTRLSFPMRLSSELMSDTLASAGYWIIPAGSQARTEIRDDTICDIGTVPQWFTTTYIGSVMVNL